MDKYFLDIIIYGWNFFYTRSIISLETRLRLNSRQ